MSKKRGTQHLKRKPRGVAEVRPPVPPPVNFYEMALTVEKDIAGTLRVAAERVDVITPRVAEICARLVWVTRHDPNCAGIAAPQVGVRLRIFTVKDSEKRVSCWINPEIEPRSDALLVAEFEGCFSLPDKRVRIARHSAVVVRGLAPTGKMAERSFYGTAARAAQHEMDHLNGVLISDHGELRPVPGDVIATGAKVTDPALFPGFMVEHG